MGDNADQEMLKKLENASPEDARKLIIQSIIPQCRDIASTYFDCIEEGLAVFHKNNMTLSELDKEFNNKIGPECMQKFNLEECLKQNGPGH